MHISSFEEYLIHEPGEYLFEVLDANALGNFEGFYFGVKLRSDHDLEIWDFLEILLLEVVEGILEAGGCPQRLEVSKVLVIGEL